MLVLVQETLTEKNSPLLSDFAPVLSFFSKASSAGRFQSLGTGSGFYMLSNHPEIEI